MANPAPGQTGPTGGTSWPTDVLAGLGAPTSSNNAAKVIAWQACEGGDSLKRNNPFNTTLDAAGASSINSDGVKSYPTWAIGLKATVSTISQNNMSNIRKNLVGDGSFQDFVNALATDPWGTSPTCVASRLGTGAPVTTAAAVGGAGSTGSGSSGQGTAGQDLSKCAIGTPSLPLVGSTCLLTKGNLKAIKGGLILVAGGGMFVVGALVLVAGGFGSTGIGAGAAKTLKTVTPAGRALGGAGKAVGSVTKKAATAPRRRRQAAEDDELLARSTGSRAANRRGYRRAMGAPRDIDAEAPII